MCVAYSALTNFRREVTLLLVGLDSAGKSTLLANLNGESMDDVTPTVGFSSTTLDVGRCTVTFYDLGGGAKIRDIWKNYYAKVGGERGLVEMDHYLS